MTCKVDEVYLLVEQAHAGKATSARNGTAAHCRPLVPARERVGLVDDPAASSIQGLHSRVITRRAGSAVIVSFIFTSHPPSPTFTPHRVVSSFILHTPAHTQHHRYISPLGLWEHVSSSAGSGTSTLFGNLNLQTDLSAAPGHFRTLPGQTPRSEVYHFVS